MMKQDKMKGFDIGVDDYITKPFDEDELLCRINAIITRYNIQPNEEVSKEIYQFGIFTFDYKNLLLKSSTSKKRLTQKESEVLRILCLRPNEIITRENIMVSIWGNNDYFIGRSLDVFIAKLRKYLSEDPDINIENIPKIGYILRTEQ
jgi:DNA-binding response OmpR family regulator